MEQIVLKDFKLVDILQNNLKEYIHEDIPTHILDNTIEEILHTIQNDINKNKNIIHIDENFYWDKNYRQLFYNKKEIDLTRMEVKLLTLLFSSVNRGFSYDDIFISLWDNLDLAKHESLKTIVKQLRKKLPKNIIKNIFAYGYKITL